MTAARAVQVGWIRTGRPPWTPGPDCRVLTDDAALTTTATRLATDLGLDAATAVGHGTPSPGDVVLILAGPAGTADHPPAGFTLEVDDGVRVTARHGAGVLAGTQALLHELAATGEVPSGTLSREPLVAERGLHVDAGRKYFTPPWWHRVLGEMARRGLNTLQMHLSENEGYRVQSRRHPEVVADEHLTLEEIAEIVALASELHIIVIPALDVPGHLGGVLAAHPELGLPRADGTRSTTALDITNPAAVSLVTDLVDELMAVFPGPVWHLGADEFVELAEADERYPALTQHARMRFGPDARAADAFAGFVADLTAFVESRGYRARAWNDGLYQGTDRPLPASLEVAHWTSWSPRMRPVQHFLAAGHRVVNVNDRFLYHVLGEANGYRYPTPGPICQEWHPGVFSPLSDGTPQTWDGPPPTWLTGAQLAIWSDVPDAQNEDDVLDSVLPALTAFAARTWGGEHTWPALAGATERPPRSAPHDRPETP